LKGSVSVIMTTSRNCSPSSTGSAPSRRPRQRPDQVIADRGYDRDKYRRELWRRGVTPRIARRCTEHGSGLGRVRWVVERTLLSFGCSLICWRHIRP
jgi:hypothetical protein